MNLTALRQNATKTPRQDAFTGTWRAISWQPDLFTPQRFVVGALVESSDGQRAFKLMEKPGRIECFFRPKPIRREFSALIAMVRSSLSAAGIGQWVPPSANFTQSEPCFVRGESAEAVADRLFLEMVSAAKALPDDPDQPIGPDTEETRREVSNFLKQMTQLSYERIIREKGETLDKHHFDVTLAPDQGAGSIISTCYKSLPTIELKLLRTAHDINAYASSQKRKSKAIFVLEPDDDALLPAKTRKDMEALIGNECWKLEQSGFITPRNTRFYDMAQDIRDWAVPLLA